MYYDFFIEPRLVLEQNPIFKVFMTICHHQLSRHGRSSGREPNREHQTGHPTILCKFCVCESFNFLDNSMNDRNRKKINASLESSQSLKVP